MGVYKRTKYLLYPTQRRKEAEKLAQTASKTDKIEDTSDGKTRRKSQTVMLTPQVELISLT